MVKAILQGFFLFVFQEQGFPNQKMGFRKSPLLCELSIQFHLCSAVPSLGSRMVCVGASAQMSCFMVLWKTRKQIQLPRASWCSDLVNVEVGQYAVVQVGDAFFYNIFTSPAIADLVGKPMPSKSYSTCELQLPQSHTIKYGISLETYPERSVVHQNFGCIG